MQFTINKKPRISFSLDNQIEITFTTQKSNLEQFSRLKDENMVVEIKKQTKKRTMSQNSYMWVLLDEIGKKVNRSKEDIYKTYVKDYGVFEIIPIKNEAVDSFIQKWSKNGLGWLCEDLGESKLKGYTKLITYFGSSTYTSSEMARLLEAIIDDCKELDIETLTMKDIMLLQNDNDKPMNK